MGARARTLGDHQNLTYNGVRAVSIVEAVPALADTTILLNGVAKTYTMTGWRVGRLVAPAGVVAAASNLQSHLTSNVSNVSQRAAIAALTGPAETVERMRLAFEHRRDLMVAGLNSIPGVFCPTPEGAYYVYPDITGLLGRDWHGVVPQTSHAGRPHPGLGERRRGSGEAFGPSGFLRFSYALGEDELSEGLRRLQELFA